MKDDPTVSQLTAEATYAFLDTIKLPAVDPTMLSHLNAPITFHEIQKLTLVNNKSPGADGFLTNIIMHLEKY